MNKLEDLKTLQGLQEYQEKLNQKKEQILKDLQGFNLLKNSSLNILEKETDKVSEKIFEILHLEPLYTEKNDI